MKKYIIQWNDEKLLMTRTNDGFSPIELIGILELTLISIKDQMSVKETTPIKTIKKRIENK